MPWVEDASAICCLNISVPVGLVRLKKVIAGSGLNELADKPIHVSWPIRSSNVRSE